MKFEALAKVADIQTGPFGSQLHKEDYVESGTPIVTVEHLGQRNFTEQNLPKVSPQDKVRLNKYILREGDIVFSRVGSVDRCSYVDKAHDGWMFSGRCLRVRPSKLIDPLFLYYYFCLESTKQFIKMIAVGATMPSINTKILGEVEILLPPIPKQKTIANMLSILDDKIELNQRINENLESQAEAIFKSWFVDGKEPNSCLFDICQYSKEKIALSKLNLDNYYSTENMLPDKAGATRATTLPTIAQTTRYKAGDVLISNIRPYFKKIVYCYSEGGCSTDVLCFVPQRPELSAFLFNTLYNNSFFDFMVAGSKGTKMPRGDKQHIMTYPIYVPPNEELIEINGVVEPILEMIRFNREENKILVSLRNELLPKLMSGEIDLRSVNI